MKYCYHNLHTVLTFGTDFRCQQVLNFQTCPSKHSKYPLLTWLQQTLQCMLWDSKAVSLKSPGLNNAIALGFKVFQLSIEDINSIAFKPVTLHIKSYASITRTFHQTPNLLQIITIIKLPIILFSQQNWRQIPRFKSIRQQLMCSIEKKKLLVHYPPPPHFS